MTRTDLAAKELVEALDQGTARSPDPQLSISEAYRVTAAIRELRERRGEKVVGRKIGFTNSNIWPEYGISDPIWGYMYDTTVRSIGSASAVSVSHLLEPRIEPEICFGLSSAPTVETDNDDLIECIAWVAHGFEIVQSLYPGWKLGVADAIAAQGMHGFYVLGQPHELSPGDRDAWSKAPPTFEVALACNGKTVDRGMGSNVLGGPVSALRHLIGLLARDPSNPDLAPGEVITTGSLTGAFPVNRGENWHTTIGLPVNGLAITIE